MNNWTGKLQEPLNNWRRKLKDSTTVIAWLSLIVAVLGGIPGLISIKKELWATRIDIAYDRQQTFLAELASDQKDHFGKKVIGFYGIRFVGTGDIPLSIKDIRFYVRVG